jgi:ABC-2 type transport system ATP-binding protein
MTPAVQIRNVTKTYGAQAAVDGLSLDVPPGSVYGFIGPNGSGKTTTLRMIMRIIRPDRGGIEVLGQQSNSRILDRVAYLPEERMLYKQMRVYDVLRFFARLKNHNPPQAEMGQWLDRLFPDDGGGERIGKMRVEQLSKGMTQKVQLIATLIAKPQLVLLDEPFSGLDPVNAVVLRDTIIDLRRGGTTVIFSTHDMSVAERMCDFIFMIYKGRKVLDGTLDSIQQTYGADIVRVRLESGNGHAPSLDGLPGVVKVTDFGKLQELRLSAGTDRHALLSALMSRGKLVHFEQAHPSLQDIFVRIASPDMKGETILA